MTQSKNSGAFRLKAKASAGLPKVPPTVSGKGGNMIRKKLHIISRSSEPFADRVEAGMLLGRELKKTCDNSAVVIGIPRGGVVIAYEIADILEADLDIALARKIGSLQNPELAIGAVAENGKVFLNDVIVDQLGFPQDFTQEKERQLAIIKERRLLFRTVHSKISVKDRTVILTDDGIATGATMQAALWSVRQEHPLKVIVALPVGPEESLKRLAQDADEVVCLRVPPFLGAIGEFYSHFGQVEDEEVVEILKFTAQRSRSHA